MIAHSRLKFFPGPVKLIRSSAC